MSGNKKSFFLQKPQNPPKPKIVTSLLDEMRDGCEYESIVNCNAENVDLTQELKRVLSEITDIRNRPTVCYFSNVVNVNVKAPTMIDTTDDLPFSEMIEKINLTDKNIDIIVVTPGGYAEQVARFVNKLRPRFDSVGFILPYMCMSAGTIFCLSGDELIMDSRACIGPIDPQVPSKDGRYVPALALIALIKDIQTRGSEQLLKGLQPNWTDIQILNNLDAKELGNAISASKYSIEMVTDYLENYKFKNWSNHSKNGILVTDDERKARAQEIANQLCNHELWKTHSRGITREMANSECGLEITHPENIPGLHRSIRRFWALAYFICERSAVYKGFVSSNYCLFRMEIKS